MTQVLVTGGSGFVGGHAIVQLLAAGYEVRTTVRSLERVDKVRAMVREGGVEPGERLRFATADVQRAERRGPDAETDLAEVDEEIIDALLLKLFALSPV